MRRFSFLLVSLLVLIAMNAGVRAGEEKRELTFDDLISLGRIGSFEISPRGGKIAFTVTWFDKEDNSSNTDIYLVPVITRALDEQRQLVVVSWGLLVVPVLVGGPSSCWLRVYPLAEIP